MTLEIKERIQKIRSNIVPDGYRKTPIGMMPAAWSIKALSMIVHQVERSVPKPVTPYIRIGIRSHAKGTFHEMVNDPSKIDMDTLFVVKTNDLILNITFAWEHAIALANADDDGKLVSFRFPTYVFDNNNPVYYKYVFSQEIFRQKLDLISPGGAGRNRVLNKKDFLNIQVFVPPLAEQEKIANVLTAQDNLIALKEKLLAEKQKQKKYLMQTLLCEKSITNYKKGKTCNAWQECKIKDICTVNPSQDKPIEKKVTFLGMVDVSDEGLIINQNIVNYSTVSKGFTTFRKDDVLVAKITPCFENGKGAFTETLNTQHGFGSTEFHVLRANNKISGKFLFYITQTSTFRKKLEREMTGTAGQKRVQSSSIENYHIRIPNYDEQKKIAVILSTADKELSLLRQNIEQEKLKKKALQQLLLTGIVRVKV